MTFWAATPSEIDMAKAWLIALAVLGGCAYSVAATRPEHPCSHTARDADVIGAVGYALLALASASIGWDFDASFPPATPRAKTWARSAAVAASALAVTSALSARVGFDRCQ